MIRPFLLALALLTQNTNTPPDQSAPPDAPAPPPTAPAATSLKEVAPGVFDYNGIRLDQKNHRVTFPATVSFRQGLIEYVMVNEKGKSYESLLKTAIQPRDLHVAMLLIGLKEDAKANATAQPPPSAIDAAYLQTAPKLKGAPVLLSVAWSQDGKKKEMPLESWVFNRETNRPMSPGPWTYNGSLIDHGVFLADEELSIAAVITDPTALVNNTRKGYDNEDIWQVREEVVPPLDTPVELSITLAEPTSK